MKKLFTLLLASSFVTSIFAANITINAGKITDLNWTADNVYILAGWAYVDSLDVLTIQAGTVIKGSPGEAEASSALIVSRGGKIIANGTADEPIIFTTLADDLNGSVPEKAAGLWGGVIVLGYGQTNNGVQKSIEGISPDLEFGLYGGTSEQEVEDQDAGEMSYCSIRHGGTEIGDGNEINGLTLGAVGSGTTFSFIEVIANLDDGIEFFGGAPVVDHFLVSYCGDDCYDHDEGIRAKMQFIVAVQDTASWGECFGEHDGGSGSGENSDFVAHPVVSNATFISDLSGGASSKKAFVLRDNWSGEYHNSIFAQTAVPILVEFRPDKETHNSYYQLTQDMIVFQNNIFHNVADNSADTMLTVVDHHDNVWLDSTELQTAADAKFASWTNDLSTDPGVSIPSPVPTGNVSGAVFAGLTDFETVDYKGAFDPAVTCGHWAGGWTLTYAGTDYAVEALDCDPIISVETGNVDAFVSVYPNPVSDILTVSFLNSDISVYTINLYSANGQVVLTASTKSSQIDLDVTSLASGLYTYHLVNVNNLVSVGQIVIE